jgi:two-component system, NtrC family, sensor histidine kinase KinB
MKIKSKLFLGIGLLLIMIALLTVLSIVFVSKLSSDTKNILVANYNTLNYSRQMMNALNSGIEKQTAQAYFQENLSLQQVNITEVGEKELTTKLTADYEKLKLLPIMSFYLS